MGFETPYVINGAAHSAALFRRAFQAQNSAAEGVSLPTDFAVVPLTTPGAGFRVMPGDLVVKSRVSSRERESYHVALTEALDVPTAGTGSSGGRTDAVIVEVLDPETPGVPESTTDYVRVRVVQDVGGARYPDDVPGLAGVTCYIIGFIVYESANTSTITADMIRDGREVAVPKSKEFVFARPRVAADNTTQRFLNGQNSAGGEFFPGGAGSPNEFQVEVPEWATHMVIDASWLSIYYAANRNPYGYYWVEYGDEHRSHTWPENRQYEFGTQKFSFNAPITSDEKTANWLLMDTRPIAEKLRGKKVTFVFKAGLSNSPGSNSVWMNALGGLGMRITFVSQVQNPNLVEV